MTSEFSDIASGNLRLAVIGVGRHANRDLIPCLKGLPGVELVAIAGRDPEALAHAARRWGVTEHTSDWRVLIDAGDLHGVVASTGPAAHPDIVRACLTHDLPVYVEKPPGLTASQLRDLQRLEASRPRPRVFVGYNFAFSGPMAALADAVGPSANVSVLKVRFVSASPEGRGLYGSLEEAILWETGSHAVELAVRHLGPPQEIRASFAPISPGHIAISVLMSHADQRRSFVELGNYLDRFEFDVQMLAADGRCAALEQLNRLTSWMAGGEGGRRTLDWGIRRGGYDRAGYGPALSAFCDMIRHGGPSPSTLAHAADVHEALARILASGSAG